MASPSRRSPCLSRLLLLSSSLVLLSLLLLAPGAVLAAAKRDADVVIQGVIRLDAPVRLKSSAVRVLLDAGGKTAFVRNNGAFSLKMKPGIHFLQVTAVGATFPQVRLEVSSKQQGRFRATVLSQDGSVLSSSTDELYIAPLGPEVYFEMRQPFNPWSLLKSPMGIMTCVMVFGAVIMPYLIEGVDPEEMKQLQEQMRSQNTVASLLTGGSSGGGGSAARS